MEMTVLLSSSSLPLYLMEPSLTVNSAQPWLDLSYSHICFCFHVSSSITCDEIELLLLGSVWVCVRVCVCVCCLSPCVDLYLSSVGITESTMQTNLSLPYSQALERLVALANRPAGIT